MFKHAGCAASVLAIGFGLALALQAPAAVVINEILTNAPGGGDNGFEFFEIRSDTGATSLANLSFIVIDGDGSNAGQVDQAISLGAFSTGTNGLFLWRDAATALVPAPAAATVVNVGDFSPDIENGSNTFLLVNGFSGAVNDDLDTNDDGTLDTLPWTVVVHAMGMSENDAGNNFAYASQFGFSQLPALAAFNADALYLVPGIGLVGSDVLGTNPGPYPIDGPRVSNPAVTGSYQLSPGNDNPAVPEPGAIAAAAMAGVFAIRRRSR